jgi:hypothetical protein
MAEVAGDPQGQRFVVVVFDGVSLGIMSFAFGVFDLASSTASWPISTCGWWPVSRPPR